MPNGFSRVEFFIAGVLSRFPRLKKLIKRVYTSLIFLVYRRHGSLLIDSSLICSSAPGESFFGYYDKSPSNGSNLILCHETDIDTSKPVDCTVPVKICLYSRDFSSLLWSTQSYAYNWQQGARLHWLTDDLFIFNDFDHVRMAYISKVFSVSKMAYKMQLDLPVQDSFKDQYIISIDYQRLSAADPDYGYSNIVYGPNTNFGASTSEGIWYVSLATGDKKLLLTYQDLFGIAFKSYFESAFHCINHVSISPCGLRFVFVHRLRISDMRLDRLFSYDLATGDLTLLSDHGLVSHYAWIDTRRLLSFQKGPDGRVCYWYIDVFSGRYSSVDCLSNFPDGHPTIRENLVAFDTYPDRSRMQALYLLDTTDSSVRLVGEFFHGFDYSGCCRCDLHPRFGASRSEIFIDSVYSGKRRLYKLVIR